jgi:hypothetical protein
MSHAHCVVCGCAIPAYQAYCHSCLYVKCRVSRKDIFARLAAVGYSMREQIYNFHHYFAELDYVGRVMLIGEYERKYEEYLLDTGCYPGCPQHNSGGCDGNCPL